MAAAAPRLRRTSRALAALDVLAGLAEAASRHDYVKPRLSTADELAFVEGRHPMIERLLPEPFVANDLQLGGGQPHVYVITGPNMGGKSTFLRQVALVVLMAYAGSFVPAAAAEIGRVDRIFTRVGAADNLARGQSTFLVEMTETAKILHACTDDSLVILGEVGRGTSTHDGMSLAWAVLEYLHERGPARPRTLFATHYHELTEMSIVLDGIRNLNVAVKEWGDEIIFLRRIEEGGADKSYGIQVARLAGLPDETIKNRRMSLKRTLPSGAVEGS